MATGENRPLRPAHDRLFGESLWWVVLAIIVVLLVLAVADVRWWGGEQPVEEPVPVAAPAEPVGVPAN